MASPQLEDGHTRIANELLEALIRAGLTGCEMQVVLAVARLTYGYQKKADAISYNQIADLTRINRRNVIRTIQALVRRKVLHSVVADTRKANIFSINKHYDAWVVSPTTLPPSVVSDTTLVSPTTLAPSVTGDTLQRNKQKKEEPPPPPQGGGSLSLFPDQAEKSPAQPAKKPSATAIEKQAQEVLAHLNQVCGTKYRNPGNIPARLREGNTVQDLKAIVDCKARDDFFRENPKHLNPETLFRPKHLERYLQEARGEIKSPVQGQDGGAADAEKRRAVQEREMATKREHDKQALSPEEGMRKVKDLLSRLETRRPGFQAPCASTESARAPNPTPQEIEAERKRQLAGLQARFGMQPETIREEGQPQ